MTYPLLITELIALGFGLAYIICAHKKNNYSWICGIISAICIIIVDIQKTQLYFDALLHVFFMCMSILGLYLWTEGGVSKKEIRISKMPWLSFGLYILISTVISGVAGYLLDVNTDARYPYIDCFQMMMSVFATFLIIYCMINAWAYWVIVDIISIALYTLTGAYILAFLYVAYLVSNSIKWKEWYKRYKAQKPKYLLTNG